MSYTRRVWTDDKIDTAQQMRARGYRPPAIAKAVGLHVSQVYSRFHSTRARQRIEAGVPDSHIPESVLAERERRREIAARSLTATILGDPLPGYSALDRRLACEDRP